MKGTNGSIQVGLGTTLYNAKGRRTTTRKMHPRKSLETTNNCLP